MLKPYLMLGTVVKPQGVRGEVKLRHETDDPERFAALQTVYLRAGEAYRPLRVLAARAVGAEAYLTLEGVNDRDAAEALRGTEIWVPRSALPAPKPGEYYWVDLEGLRVETLEGVCLGTVDHLFSTGANDVVVVRGERERMLPFVQPEVVTRIDFDAGLMVVDWDPEF